MALLSRLFAWRSAGVVARPQTLTAPFVEIVSEIEALCGAGGILTEGAIDADG